MTRAFRVLAVAGVCWILAAGYGRAAPPPQVVASIMPIHSLVAGVMAGVDMPTLLVPGGGSPHGYALRPSQAQALQQADVVFWTGAGLETFLTRSLTALAGDARVVALSEADGVSLLSSRPGGVWDQHGDDADHGADSHRHSGEGAVDMHIWLDPDNAKAMVAAIAAALIRADPSRSGNYRENAARMLGRLEALDRELAARLKPVRDRPYLVFHDAYQYLERRYGLSVVGAITLGAEHQPGLQRLQAIRSRIAEAGVRCAFREPQFEPGLIRTLTEGTDVRTGVLDPLGADREPGEDAYFALMRSLAEALTNCLVPSD